MTTGYAALAEVLTGWTGSITVTVGARSVTVTPSTRESVASLWSRVQMRALAELDLTLAVVMLAADQAIAEADQAFDMTLSGNCASRTDFDSGPYSSLATYTSDANGCDGVIVPAYGMRLADAMLTSTGRAVADGSSAAVLVDSGATSRLALMINLSQAVTIEQAIAALTHTQQVHDVWHAGRLIQRVRLSGAPTRRPVARTMGTTSSPMEIAIGVTGVEPPHLVQTPAEFVTSKVAYSLWGYVRTDVPGYREVQVGSYVVRVPSGTYRWDAFITALATELGGIGWISQINGNDTPGTIRLEQDGGSPGALMFPDRLGWLLGFGLEAGVSLPSGVLFEGAFIPPGGFPLIGAAWEEAEIDRDVQAQVSRLSRDAGFAWGSARIWRLRMTMSRWHLEAYRQRWLRAGRVAIVPTGYESTAWSGSQPKGHLDGYIVSDARVRWIDPLERIAEVTTLLATTV